MEGDILCFPDRVVNAGPSCQDTRSPPDACRPLILTFSRNPRSLATMNTELQSNVSRPKSDGVSFSVCGTLLALSLMIQGASADVRLPSIMNNNMVLQHGIQAPIWGWADPGEAISVKCDGAEVKVVAAEDGSWRVRLPIHPPGDKPFELVVSGKNTLTLTNIVFGDVWVCSGQSNMGWGVGGSATPEQLEKMDYPGIRQFAMQIRPRETPGKECPIGSWKTATPKTAKEFCAVGYWFAETVQPELKIPIGLLWMAYGSSSGETWIPREALLDDPDFAPMFERAKEADKAKLEAKYKVAMAEWEVKAKEAKENNRPAPGKPTDPKETFAYIMRHAPGNCFNGSISTIIPYGIRGVIWYQGEHNAARAYQYRKVLPLLVKTWRGLWKQGDFPFLIVQLPNYLGTGALPRESDWAELREAQALTAKTVTNCHIAVTIDVGDPKDIHPKNKWDVGKRVGLLALGTVYGKNIVYTGPVFESLSFEDGKTVLKFKHVGGGLMMGRKGDETTLRGFAVAGEDHKFVWAEARIEGETVVLSSPVVSKPVAVRYAWDYTPACNLYNREGFPAAPFRTDEWPGITVNAK